MSRIQKLRRYQRKVNEYRIVELVMQLNDLQTIIEEMKDAAMRGKLTDNAVVMHFLSMPTNVSSALNSGITIQRLSSLIFCDSVTVSHNSPSIDLELEHRRIVDLSGLIE